MKKQSKGHNKLSFFKRKKQVGYVGSTNNSNYEENYYKMIDNARGSKNKKHKKHKGLKKALLIILCVFLALTLIACSIFAILYFKGKSQLKQGDVKLKLPTEIKADDNGKIIYYKGKKYSYDENVITVLCMGVDKDDKIPQKTSVQGEAGQADALYLLCIDNTQKRYNVISINRDSMIDIDEYDVTGKYLGTKNEQACLSFAYGDGREKSCKNTVKAISRMFYNIPIRAYFAMNRICIPNLNNMVGGVEVPVYDNDGNKTGQTQFLNGKSAYSYLHDRDTSKLNSNVTRMERQKSYIKAFAKKTIEKTKENISTPLDLFNTVSIYSTTSLNASKITYLTTNAFSDRNDLKIDFKSIKGDLTADKDGFAEFHIDQDSLMDLVIDVFYDEVK